MQASTHPSRFGINRIKLALVAAGLVVSSVTAIGVLSQAGELPGIGETDSANLNSTTADAQQRALAMDRSEFTEWQLRMAVAETGTYSLEVNRLPIAPTGSQVESTYTALLEANGLPIAPIAALDTSAVDRDDLLLQYMLTTQARQSARKTQVSDHAIWIVDPGHAGFINP